MFKNETSVTIDLPPRPMHQLCAKSGTPGGYSGAMQGVYVRPTSIQPDKNRRCIVCATAGISGAVFFANVIEGDDFNINDRRDYKESGKTADGKNKSIGAIVPSSMMQKPDRKQNRLQLSQGVARAYRNGVAQESECIDAMFPPLPDAMQSAHASDHKHVTIKMSELVRVAEFLGAEYVTIIVGRPDKQAKIVGWSQYDKINQTSTGIGIVCPMSIEDSMPVDHYNDYLDDVRRAWNNP